MSACVYVKHEVQLKNLPLFLMEGAIRWHYVQKSIPIIIIP